MSIRNDRQLISAVLRTDLGVFIHKVFQTVSPGDEYFPNWHIDAIVYELMRILGGQNHRLIITQPPRSLKSICVSVALVAWALGHDPGMRFICVSYSNELAAKFSRQFRAVIQSEWYLKIFPGVRILKDTETDIEATMGGGRFAVSVGGSLTGRGADIIIIDDPMKADDAHSEKARRAVKEWFGQVLLSRLDDKQKGAIVLVAQRLHQDDLAGHLLEGGGFHNLDLPAIAETDEKIAIGPGVFHERKRGEALHPEREPIEVLDKISREVGSIVFSAQYQQRPVPAGGNLFKREWISWYDDAPDRGSGAGIIQSWDIASTTADTSDWSVCTTWLRSKRNYFLLHTWRDRVEFPYLRHKLIALAHEYSPNRILIEKAGPGLHLIQDLRAYPEPGVPMPIGIQPVGDKIVRAAAQCARFEARQVHLPNDAPWLSTFLHEILAFPYGSHDDQVDSVSQFLNWAETNWSRRQTISPASGPRIFYV